MHVSVRPGPRGLDNKVSEIIPDNASDYFARTR